MFLVSKIIESIKQTPARIFLLAICLSLLNVFSIPLIAQEKYDDTRQFHKQAYQNLNKISVKIKESVADIKSGEQVELEGEYVFSKTVLPEFYENRDFMPAWDSWEAIMDAVRALEMSYQDGLNPQDYHADALEMIFGKIEHKLKENELDYDWVAEFDILITDAILLYAYHLIEGKVDPESLDPDWNYTFREISPDAPYNLEKYIESGTVSRALEQLRPQGPVYQMYIDLLAAYRVIANTGGWGTIEAGGAIKTGDEDDRIPAIRQRLYITGELTVDTNMQSMLYDENLESDIKQYQNRNALNPDGVIGKGTFKALNVSVEKKIDILRVNMERVRWITANLSDDFIIVNIAAFKAYYMKDHKIVFSTNVQVGKTYHKTPVFKEQLRYIEFNPTWTVPVSIIRKSIIPKMKKDPGYLDSHHFELLDAAGNIIPNSSVDYENLSTSNFRYTVRQKAGPWNALGEVKFIFPNKHSVYLHDTPSKSLFVQEERTFSHGCIRTQNPLDLAEVLLEGSDWTREKIDATIESRKTTRAFPSSNIDVLLLYWTAGYYNGDGIGFFKDVYERDAKVLEQLNKKDSRKPKDGKI
jgi:murein L,D-transpeptidase YcbB/YkuD